MIDTNPASERHERPVPRWRASLLGRIGIVTLVGAALALTLFPFDWLANVWPAYGAVFDRVFNSAASHHIGHTVLFGIVGLAILFIVPALARHPWRYTAIVVAGALAQESIQALAKRDWPNSGDARDIGFDLLGLALAFALVWALQRAVYWKQGAATRSLSAERDEEGSDDAEGSHADPGATAKHQVIRDQ
jgi:hypothetical protein